jgi:hypothetical protein
MDPSAEPSCQNDFNPYAPPRTDHAANRPGFELSPIPFTVGTVFSCSWTIYKARFWPSVGMVVAAGLIQAVATIGLSLSLEVVEGIEGDRLLSAFLNFVLVAMTMVLQSWINIGLIMVLLKVARGQSVEFGAMFRGGRHVLRVVGAVMLLLLIGFAYLVLAGVVLSRIPVFGRNEFKAALVWFVVMAALAFVMARLGQFFYLIVDRNAGVIEAFRHSWAMTTDRVLTTILLYIAQLLIVFAGYVACVVGLIFAVPFCLLLQVVTYLSLSGCEAEAAGEKPAPLVWEPEM